MVPLDPAPEPTPDPQATWIRETHHVRAAGSRAELSVATRTFGPARLISGFGDGLMPTVEYEGQGPDQQTGRGTP
jgi:hypothetical protein